MSFKFPTVTVDHRNNIFVTFYKDNKRFRISNGEKIGIDLKPNSYPQEQRLEMGKLLAREVCKFLESKKDIVVNKPTTRIKSNRTDFEIIIEAYNSKLKANLSEKYYQTLRHIIREIKPICGNRPVDKTVIDKFLSRYTNNTSYNTIRTHLNALLNEAVNLGLKSNPIKDIKRKRQEAKLHKPFQDILLVLNDIKEFHTHLYLCCLLTYGCLIRPHREIRELKWSDFSDDYNYINLSGSRNKSKKNRIVPVPEFVKNELSPTLLNHNIFSGDTN